MRDGRTERGDLRCGDSSSKSQSLRRVAFLEVPLATFFALEDVDIRKPTKPRRPSNEVHGPGAANAAGRLRCGLADRFVVHNTVSNSLAALTSGRPRIWGASITATWPAA
jgi:hypothetical protein